MNNYWEQIDPTSPMFDFKEFYTWIAEDLPNDCRLFEVGVANGKSGIYLAEALHNLGKKFKMYFIENMDYGKDEQRNTIIKHLIKSGMGEYVELLEMSSLDASTKFPDNYFHFGFLDSSHTYQQTKSEIKCWYPKILDEHIFAGHDFNDVEGCEVKQAVTEIIPETIIKANEETPTITLHEFQTTNNYNVWWCRKDWQLTKNIKIA